MTTKVKLLHDTVGIPTGAVAVTQSASDNTTKVATTAYVTTALANLADSAPSTLNTLNELAAALGDDANFSTTVTNSIAAKLPLAGGTLTGTLIGTELNLNAAGDIHSTVNNSYMGLSGGTETNAGANIILYGQSHGSLANTSVFRSSGTERMRIDSSGNVGIGTGASIDAPLHVQYTGTGSGLVLESTEAGASNAPDLVLYRNSSSPADSDDIGNILFRGKDDAGNDNSYAFIMAEIGDASNGSEDGNLFFRTQSGGSLDNRLSIVSNNIGIGTSSPTHTLHVNNSLRASSSLVSIDPTGSASAPSLIFNGDDNSGLYRPASDNLAVSTAGTERMRIDSSGNVGIGTTSPTYTLDVAGDIGVNEYIYHNDDTNTYLRFTPDQLDIRVGGDDRFTIASGGDINITKSARIQQRALTSSSNAVVWNAKSEANAYHVTTENTTFSAPSNAVEGAIISVEIAQGGTARTIAWNTVFEFAASTAPTVTATANKTDIFTFRYNGSVWQEIGRVQNMAQT